MKGVSQAPQWLLHQLVEQHIALTGCHLVFTDRGDTTKKGDGEGVVIIHVYYPLPMRSTSQHPRRDERAHLPFDQALCPPEVSIRERCQVAVGMGQELSRRLFLP